MNSVQEMLSFEYNIEKKQEQHGQHDDSSEMRSVDF